MWGFKMLAFSRGRERMASLKQGLCGTPERFGRRYGFDYSTITVLCQNPVPAVSHGTLSLARARFQPESKTPHVGGGTLRSPRVLVLDLELLHGGMVMQNHGLLVDARIWRFGYWI